MSPLRAVAGALAAALLLAVPARAGLGEDLARCQSSVWPRFTGWSLSRQQGPDSPRTPDDFYCLALGHWSGQGPFQSKEPVKAAGYARTAAEQNHAGAQGLLGFFLSRGIGGKADPAAAVGWWRKGAAQGHADSLNALAAAYESGEGVAADRQEAVRLYRQAAERGSKEAQQRLAALAGKLRTGLLWEEPVGMLFHNSGERLAYIKNLRYRVDRYEAYQAWVLRRNEYDDCKRQNRTPCSDPGPAPQ